METSNLNFQSEHDFFFSLIVNKAERKMKKGGGYHLDIFLIGLFGTLCGILGLPLMVAATGMLNTMFTTSLLLNVEKRHKVFGKLFMCVIDVLNIKVALIC